MRLEPQAYAMTEAPQPDPSSEDSTTPTFWDKVTIQPDDTRAQATVKILTGIGLAILLLVISPLIIFGLVVGLMTVA